MSNEIQISVDHVSVEYTMERNGIRSIKEYAVSLLKGQVQKDSFQALNDVTFSVKHGEVFGIVGKMAQEKAPFLKLFLVFLSRARDPFKSMALLRPY